MHETDLGASRLATAFWAVYAMVFANYASNFGALIKAVNYVGSQFGGMLGVFVLALFVRRYTATAAFIGVIAGELAIFITARFTGSYFWLNVIGGVAVVLTGILASARPTLERARGVACCLAGTWFAACVALGAIEWNIGIFLGQFVSSNMDLLKKLAMAVWTIAPPLFFLYEHYLFGVHNPAAPPETTERFRRGQDLAGKVWIAVAAVLLALFFGSRIPIIFD